MKRSACIQCLLRWKSSVAAILWITAGMVAVDAASAQDVSYQENLGNGETATFILQNYTVGTALSTSNFVGISLSGATANDSFNLADSIPTYLTGSISPINPSTDNVALVLSLPQANLKPGEFVFTQQNGVVTFHECGPGEGCKPGGNNGQAAKFFLPPGIGFQTTASAPEIDMNSLSSALTLLFGCVLVLRARFKQSY
jgi:hypothetical protein